MIASLNPINDKIIRLSQLYRALHVIDSYRNEDRIKKIHDFMVDEVLREAHGIELEIHGILYDREHPRGDF